MNTPRGRQIFPRRGLGNIRRPPLVGWLGGGGRGGGQAALKRRSARGARVGARAPRALTLGGP